MTASRLHIPLKPGQVVSNKILMEIFECACEGGIRYSSRTGTIVLVINNTRGIQKSGWQGNRIDFIGQKEKTPDKITRMNKRLRDFLEARQGVFLFEVNSPGQYEYRGPVTLAAPPYPARSPQGECEWIFPLALA